MARRFKSFGSPIVGNDDPVEFELYNTIFRCVPAIQGKKMLEFISATNDDDYSASADALLEFINTCVVPAQREELSIMLSSDDQIVPMDVLTEITSFLVESYSGTVGANESGKSESSPSEPSSNGQMNTVSLSEDVPLPLE